MKRAAVLLLVLLLAGCGSPRPTPTDPPALLDEGAVADRPGIFVVAVDSGKVWQVGPSHNAMLAPDGKSLLRYSHVGLDVVDWVSGTSDRLFAGAVSDATWSPDGTQIAFAPTLPGGGSSVQTEGVYLIHRNGGAVRRLAGQADRTHLAWSPAGDYLLWSTWADGRAYTYLVPVTGGEPTKLEGSAVWSPDGESLAVASSRGIQLVYPDTGRLRELTTVSPDGVLTWAPDGRQLLLGEYLTGGPRLPHSRLFSRIDLEWREPWAQPLAIAYDSPAWSPDSQQIVYISDGCTNDSWDLWVVRADPRERRQLTHSPEVLKATPLWSPDGRNIVYGAADRLVLVDPATGNEATLVETQGMAMLHPVAWSADSRHILFMPSPGRGVCD